VIISDAVANSYLREADGHLIRPFKNDSLQGAVPPTRRPRFFGLCCGNCTVAPKMCPCGVSSQKGMVFHYRLERPSDIDKDSEGLVELLHMAATVERLAAGSNGLVRGRFSRQSLRSAILPPATISRYRSSSSATKRGGRFRRGFATSSLHRRNQKEPSSLRKLAAKPRFQWTEQGDLS